MTIRILLADDEPLVRTGIAMILRVEADMETVGTANNGFEAVELARTLAPDVILMDLRMPIMDGVEATRRIVEMASGKAEAYAVLVLTTYRDDESVYGALRAGASGFVLKDAVPDELISAVRAVAAGEAWLDPAIARRLLTDFKVSQPHCGEGQLTALTRRETDVLVLVAHGLSNGEISRHLVVSEATVKTHVSRILMKLGLRDRAQAVGIAYRSGLVHPTAPTPRPPQP